MFRLRLNGRSCLSCGICMDVCLPGAIDMRGVEGAAIEGEMLSYVYLSMKSDREAVAAKMGTFPFMMRPDQCDGCLRCVVECPVDALRLRVLRSSANASSKALHQNEAGR